MEQPQYCPSTEYITEISSTLPRILVASMCSLYLLEEFRLIKLTEILKQVNPSVEQRKGKIVPITVVGLLIISIMHILRLS